MAPYDNESDSNGRGRDLLVAGIVLVMALSTSFLAEPRQQRISAALQVSVLRPFIATQERLEQSRIGAAEADSLMALVDSLSSRLSTQSALRDENRNLRALLQIAERAGPEYLPATLLRPGTPGSESMFLVDRGARDGLVEGSPVVSAHGLVGVVREVRERNSVGIDWSHPEFRASAMLADGLVYGLVENRRGAFREEDRLLLNGIPFNEPVAPASLVVTSGLGGIYPRGIPIGRLDALADQEGTWRKSFWLVPMVHPGAATHVLVLRGGGAGDVTEVWIADSPSGDSIATEGDGR
ncbi:MAG: rod shape-determining protein MreC [Gemmatimonadetes bacterium]|nr:rod shape-determining protein MreC [Gemmatimonadota bacterium]NNF12106.1 rod shape-determining protein MreC [Gemmatimonadota bacterium]